MLFQDLLRLHRLPQTEVALCLHKPSDPIARRSLSMLADERPDLFDIYQSTHAPAPETTLRNRACLASFLAVPGGDVVFLGLFQREIGPVLSINDWLDDPGRREMLDRVDGHIARPEERAARLGGRTLFHLRRHDAFADLEKRLVCQDPGGRTYMRLAETTPLQVLEIRRHGQVAPPMPDWTELTLTRREIQSLPRDWAITLRNWRGIYLIVDEKDGQRYVGSAYGVDNLLGRWQQHTAGDRGVTRELAHRDPATFRFAILELVSPTALPEEVLARENSWKLRLDTRRNGLNGN
ncbi:GIY-YIG nuclease family protein [Salipiger aestuarii]|uniref:GIY-YIG catalytic domain-containing protein n=1 Tax=Salipiger aestuarii TaxID=568098 RepID=A0A327YSR5_9RHOB|nr:GIY-YIG nuclease family protein [Salipiger aestuarii]EIE51138.1 hypothetical protein C357_09977 [Citreicella sp. 357]RAK23963.1 GIY-YIG catalytic domain-containing protein [Salipiger aestuarii]